MDENDFGPCCVCGGRKNVRNIIMLDKKVPAVAKGKGWGCIVCGLESDGAVACVCDACIGKELIYACLGYPSSGERIPISELVGEHEHKLELHEAEDFPALIPAQSFTCPKCGRVSYHLRDVAEGYCGACHEFFPE